MRSMRSSGNVFLDIGFPPHEAQNLRVRADLMIELIRLVRSRKLTLATGAGSVLRSDTGAINLSIGVGDNDNDATLSINGTLSGNPLAMAAGISTLEILQEPGAYESLEQRSAQLATGLTQAASDANIPITLNRVGSMLTVFFTRTPSEPITNYTQATTCDTTRFAKFFHAMLDQGIYLPPSQFEAFLFESQAVRRAGIGRVIQRPAAGL